MADVGVRAPTIDVRVRPADLQLRLEQDARTGLTATPKSLPPVWFYDERGSRLFDEITRLPEYYLTRAEREILRTHAVDIGALAAVDTLVELGSGTSEKTILLIDALRLHGLERFVPFDVSQEVLVDAADQLAARYPGLEVHAVVGDFHRHLGALPATDARLIAFLGSTIGNLTAAERARFLFDLDAVMTSRDFLLLGTDLVKDTARLMAAYNDPEGVTAEFNRNVVHVLNRELGASFDPEAFAHFARWNEVEQWMEIGLRAGHTHDVSVKVLDLDIHFEEGEELHTEISAKFTRERVHEELVAAGFVVEAAWTDPAGDFLLTLARPYC